MNLKLALKNTGYSRCNACCRIHKPGKGQCCLDCHCTYCDGHDSELEEGICPECDLDNWYRQNADYIDPSDAARMAAEEDL